MIWWKAAHIIGAFAWMAGLFYLPRLFVYHSSELVGSAPSEMLKRMERRLMKGIMRPSAALTLVAGAMTGHLAGVFSAWPLWFVIKFISVFGLLVVHMMLEMHLKAFAHDERRFNHLYYRILNEIPTLLLVVIVIMVVVKP